MKLFRLIREIINFLYIFSIVNDNFIVDYLGTSSLKVMFVVFAFVNLMSLGRFKYNKKVSRRFLFLIGMLILAYLFNLKNYDDLQQPLLSILSVIMIYIVAVTHQRPRLLITFFLISVFVSSLICITSDTTLTEYTFRKTGGTGDPNEFSMMLLISIGYLVGKWRLHSSFMYKIVHIFAVLVYFVALFMAGSKSAMLVLIVLAGAYYILLLRKWTLKSMIKNTLIYVALFTLLVVVLWNLNRGMILNVFERFEDNSSAGERLLSWSYGLKLWLNYPLFGVGPQNYVHMIEQNYPYIAEASRAAHSIYIQSFVETGVFGFSSFLVFIYLSIRNAYRKVLPVEYSLGLICILVMGFTLAAFYEKYVWLYFGIICNPYVIQQIAEKRR